MFHISEGNPTACKKIQWTEYIIHFYPEEAAKSDALQQSHKNKWEHNFMCNCFVSTYEKEMHAFNGAVFTYSIHAFGDLNFIFQWSKKYMVSEAFLLLNMKPNLLKLIFSLETYVANNN